MRARGSSQLPHRSRLPVVREGVLPRWEHATAPRWPGVSVTVVSAPAHVSGDGAGATPHAVVLRSRDAQVHRSRQADGVSHHESEAPSRWEHPARPTLRSSPRPASPQDEGRPHVGHVVGPRRQPAAQRTREPCRFHAGTTSSASLDSDQPGPRRSPTSGECSGVHVPGGTHTATRPPGSTTGATRTSGPRRYCSSASRAARCSGCARGMGRISGAPVPAAARAAATRYGRRRRRSRHASTAAAP